MNTQTHLLLATAILVPAATVYCSANDAQDLQTVTKARTVPKASVLLLTIAAVSGALIPDAGLFMMWGIAKTQGVAESVIWSDWYYSEFWQWVGALTNSLPLYLMLVLVSWLAGARYHFISSIFSGPASKSMTRDGQSFSSSGRRAAEFTLIFGSAAVLHVLADLPLHHDDGHPHFWPFSYWIYSSPVSYWDPAHYGRIWSFIELMLALLLIVIIWRRIQTQVGRFLLLLLGLSYFLALAYWLSAF